MFKNPFKKDKIEEFWKWFSKVSDQYFEFENNQTQLFESLSRTLLYYVGFPLQKFRFLRLALRLLFETK